MCVCDRVYLCVCMCGGHEVSFDVVGDFELVAVELDSLQVYQGLSCTSCPGTINWFVGLCIVVFHTSSTSNGDQV